MNKTELSQVLESHRKWLMGEKDGVRANLSGVDLRGVDLRGADLRGADLRGADLRDADLRGADLRDADLRGAVLSGAVLRGADLSRADLRGADLSRADLRGADLSRADLRDADLSGADLRDADLSRAVLRGADLSRANLSRADLGDADLRDANLRDADLSGADLRDAELSGVDLRDAKSLCKLMGVEIGNLYWKRFKSGLNNQGFQYVVGLNVLRDGEVFASDERKTCDFPAFHFASRSWCAVNYPDRPLEARIRIPEGAQINEPWATDGKASADKIEILQVFDVKTGEDVTKKYKGKG